MWYNTELPTENPLRPGWHRSVSAPEERRLHTWGCSLGIQGRCCKLTPYPQGKGARGCPVPVTLLTCHFLRGNKLYCTTVYHYSVEYAHLSGYIYMVSHLYIFIYSVCVCGYTCTHTHHAVHFCQGTSVLLFFSAPVRQQKQPLQQGTYVCARLSSV